MSDVTFSPMCYSDTQLLKFLPNKIPSFKKIIIPDGIVCYVSQYSPEKQSQ